MIVLTSTLSKVWSALIHSFVLLLMTFKSIILGVSTSWTIYSSITNPLSTNLCSKLCTIKSIAILFRSDWMGLPLGTIRSAYFIVGLTNSEWAGFTNLWYYFNTPSSVRPRSTISRSILRESLTSSSVCTKIFKSRNYSLISWSSKAKIPSKIISGAHFLWMPIYLRLQVLKS
jgi:hypothetical protein